MTKPPDPALAAVLRRFRLRAGVTQENLAFEADVTISALARIERGASNPAWTSVRAIAGALDVSLDELGAAVEQEQR
jgi:transcriptional regulator with XRE-family HTH domain